MGSRMWGGWSCTVTGGAGWATGLRCLDLALFGPTTVRSFRCSRRQMVLELSSTAHAWPTANDDGAISVDILRKLTGAGATAISNTRWISGDTCDGFCFSDRVTEWIEEISKKATTRIRIRRRGRSSAEQSARP